MGWSQPGLHVQCRCHQPLVYPGWLPARNGLRMKNGLDPGWWNHAPAHTCPPQVLLPSCLPQVLPVAHFPIRAVVSVYVQRVWVPRHEIWYPGMNWSTNAMTLHDFVLPHKFRCTSPYLRLDPALVPLPWWLRHHSFSSPSAYSGTWTYDEIVVTTGPLVPCVHGSLTSYWSNL